MGLIIGPLTKTKVIPFQVRFCKAGVFWSIGVMEYWSFEAEIRIAIIVFHYSNTPLLQYCQHPVITTQYKLLPFSGL